MPLTESKARRARAVRQALSHPRRAVPSAPELAVLTQYVLGSLDLEQTNAVLRQHGRTLVAA